MLDKPTTQADASLMDRDTRTPTLNDLQSELDALVDAGVAAEDSKVFIHAQRALLLLEFVCRTAQTDTTGTELRDLARSLLTVAEYPYLTQPDATLGSKRNRRRRKGKQTPVKLRAVAYVRESTEEQGQGFSPDAQRETIRKFAAENNLELIGEYCDFHSGWRKSEGRPEFQRLMADAAQAQFDVVLVFHTSRFARSQVEARRYKQLLRERLGIRVVSVT